MSNYKKKSLINTTSALIMQVVVMLTGLVLPRLYLTAYGSEVNGLVSSINQFISYLTLVEAGLAGAGINALFEPLSNRDSSKINGVLNAIRKFYFQIGYIFSGLVVGLAVLYPLFVSIEGFSYLRLALLVVVLGLHGTIDFFTLSKYRALLTADQKYSVIANATTIAYIVNFIAVVACIKLGGSIILARAVALTMYIVRTLIINIYVRAHYKNLDSRVPCNDKALNKRWDAMVLQLLGLAQTSMPVIVLTFFSKTLSDVSVYSIYNLVASSLLSLLNSMTNGVTATFGDIIARKDEERLKKWYQTFEFIFLGICSIVYSVTAIMYIPFVSLYVSGVTDYEYIYPVLGILFAANGLAYNIKTPAGILIGAAGVYKETKKGTFIQTIIAVAGCVVFTPFLGITGLLLGLMASNIYRDFELIIFMSKNVTHLSLIATLKNVLCCILPFGIVIAVTLVNPLQVTSVISWVVNALLATIACTLLFVVISLIFNRTVLVDALRAALSKTMRRKRA